MRYNQDFLILSIRLCEIDRFLWCLRLENLSNHISEASPDGSALLIMNCQVTHTRYCSGAPYRRQNAWRRPVRIPATEMTGKHGISIRITYHSHHRINRGVITIREVPRMADDKTARIRFSSHKYRTRMELNVFMPTSEACAHREHPESGSCNCQ